MNNPFNELTDAEDERLTILAEECAEVIQAICKIQRHGFASVNPKDESDDAETNKDALSRELGDLLHAMDRCSVAGDIDQEYVAHRRVSKPETIRRYLHHQ